MEDAGRIMELVREKRPLAHHITNWVTIYQCATIVRSFGALPVMAHAKEESADMAKIASCLVLNIGTLTPELVDSMILAGNAANSKGIPVVLDAVGAGATSYRTAESKRLLSTIKIDVIKGNAGEIGTLAGVRAEVLGVESISVAQSPAEVAAKLAKSSGSVVVITGKQDIVAGKDCTYFINNGHPLMGEVVGTGCMASSVIGAFCAVEGDYAKASACALACFGIAGELAAEKAGGPGTFLELLFDEVALLSEEKIRKRIRVERKWRA